MPDSASSANVSAVNNSSIETISAYEFGAFRLNVREATLVKDGAPVRIRPKIFDMLLALVRGGGQVVSQEELMQIVWSDATVDRANLAVSINHLRKALNDNDKTDGKRMIETVPKRGYRFAAPMRRIEKERARSALATGSSRARVIEETEQESLAVLPLVDESRNQDTEYLADGITESIINNLSRLRRLRVMGRSTVFAYKNSERAARDIGRELRVGAALTGRISSFGDNVILSVELIDTNDGTQLWGEQFRHSSADVFLLQEEIATEISDKLRLRLTGAERAGLAKHPTENSEAYRAYLKGRYFSNRFDAPKAIEYFEQAIEIDPKYALAYSGIADAYNLLGLTSVGIHPPAENFARAKRAATRALEIDELLAEAHAALGLATLTHDWNLTEAGASLARAVELNPNYGMAHEWRFFHRTVSGQTEAGVQSIKRALELDPLSPNINTATAFALYTARRYDEAEAQCLKTLEIMPNFPPAQWGMAWGFVQKKMYREAIRFARMSVAGSGRDPVALVTLGHALAVAGKRREARLVLEDVLEVARVRYVSPYYIAFIHVGLGDTDKAFECLETAYRHRDFWVLWLIEPRFDSLRDDSRFVELTRLIGLSDGR